MKAIEVLLFLVAVAALIGIGIERFLIPPNDVLGFSAGNLVTLANTILILCVLAKLHSK